MIVVIASGPSLTKADVDYCRGKARVLVVNDNYHLAPWADWLYACDYRWWACKALNHDEPNHAVTNRIFAGQRFMLSDAGKNPWGIKELTGKPGMALSKDPSMVYWGGTSDEGGNSGFQALTLAYHLHEPGEPIALLGFDMGATGCSHWFGEHPVGLGNPIARRFPIWCDGFRKIAADLANEGVEVINCTRTTALDCFRQLTIEDVI